MAAAAAQIAARLIKEAPPAQLREVLAGVRVLLGDERNAVEATLPAVVAELLAKHYTPVALPTGGSALLTPDNLRAGTAGSVPAFLEPRTRQLLDIDFCLDRGSATPGAPVCKSSSHLPAAEAAALDAAEPLREAVERELGAYVADLYPSATLAVFSAVDASTGAPTVVACWSAQHSALPNFYAGGLRCRWQVSLVAEEESAEVAGEAHCRVHYFEDGNVQMAASDKWAATLGAGDGVDDLAGVLVECVRESESGWHEQLLDAFASLGENAIKALRRPLPMTKSKFDWERAAQHGVADELAGMKL
ncbi:F-actin-capping protein subunit alpha [Pavlovales sp. CCMP2436]|nr:F-actin-capping protein subunit alpha [Pavlovales sp. CCMP2436]